MKDATKPEVDLWSDPPEMEGQEKAEVLRAALDEAWESDARGESMTFTLGTLDALLEEVGRRADCESTGKQDEAAALSRCVSTD